jgi:hypothetical protein
LTWPYHWSLFLSMMSIMSGFSFTPKSLIPWRIIFVLATHSGLKGTYTKLWMKRLSKQRSPQDDHFKTYDRMQPPPQHYANLASSVFHASVRLCMTDKVVCILYSKIVAGYSYHVAEKWGRPGFPGLMWLDLIGMRCTIFCLCAARSIPPFIGWNKQCMRLSIYDNCLSTPILLGFRVLDCSK